MTDHLADDVAWIWWFDRQGAIQSAGINFIRDLPYFVVLLVAFQRFDLQHWGIIEGLNPYTDARGESVFNVNFPEEGLIVTADAGEADLYERYSLTGRGTRVYTAIGACDKQGQSISTNPHIGTDLPKRDMALKIYWPESSRLDEAEVLKMAHAMGNTNPCIKDHVPELLASYTYAYSTSTIRSRLGFDIKGNRVLRALLLQLLAPLDPNNLSIKDFMHGWKECFICKSAGIFISSRFAEITIRPFPSMGGWHRAW